MRYRCSLGFLLLAAGLIYLDGISLVLLGLAACVLHEAGHWVMIRVLGGRVCCVHLTAVGAEMVMDPVVPLSYWREGIAALAGPAVNLALAYVSVRCGWHLFAGLNLCFGVLNLLPVRPLDGGRVLECLLLPLWPFGADRVLRVVSILFSGALLGLGWAAWRGWGNLSLLFVALWLTFGTIKTSF